MHSRRDFYFTLVIIMGIAIGAWLPSAHAVVNGQEPGEVDFRFDGIAAFSYTAWLTEELPGQPDDGDAFEHNHFGNGVLIAPDLMVAAAHLVSFDAGNPPPPGLFTFRFRRNVDGSLGSVSQGWQSFHQVTAEEFIFLENSLHFDMMFVRLSEPVAHITPLQLATASEITALIPGTDVVTVAGWGKVGPGFDEGVRDRLRFAQPLFDSLQCNALGFLSFSDPNNPCACGVNSHDSGGAVLISSGGGSLKLAAVIASPSAGVLVNPIAEPADPAPLNRDRRHDPVCAFGATSWLSEELTGQPDDGDDREHEYSANGILISPTQVLLRDTAIGALNPNGVSYSTSNLPPAGLFSVRFRYRTDDGVGSIQSGWESFHQVSIASYTIDTGPTLPGTGLIIANLATPVTHIEPMEIATIAAVEALETTDSIRVSGWAWGSDATIGPRTRADEVASVNCEVLLIDGPDAAFPDSCGGKIYSHGAAVVIERYTRMYTAADLETLHVAENEKYDPVTEAEIPVVYTLDSDPQFNVQYFASAQPVFVSWFELVGLATNREATAARLAIASTLVDPCYAYECDRQPLPPLAACADFNDDGIVDQADGVLMQGNFGACADCEDCPYDLDGDCGVFESDYVLWAAQAVAGLCPCRADFNLDGVVDQLDIDHLIANLGPCDCDDECPPDLNGDRVVSEADLTLLLDLPDSICTY